MAKTVDLEAALIRSIELGITGDIGSLRQYARQLLRHLEPPDRTLRQSLAAILAEAGSKRAELRTANPAGSPSISTDESLTRVEYLDDAPEPLLPTEPSNRLREVISERKALAELLETGLAPTRSLLLVGPPGVGKTMTARYLAARIGDPLITVDLSSVMSRFLGRTGQNLRLALEQARLIPAVCLLDEFDALGKKRDDPTDVGELKRIVTIVLHELETWPNHSLLVAATNHPELLDRAVWRRFDRVLYLELPGDEERRKIIIAETRRNNQTIGEDAVSVLVHATESWSGSDIVRLIRESIRGVILDRWPTVDRGVVELLLRTQTGEWRKPPNDPRANFIRLATDIAGLSQRATARLLAISHVTVGRICRSQQTALEAQGNQNAQ